MSESEFQHDLKSQFAGLELTIILINPENRGNIGSIARIMKNFACQNLILVNPIEDHLDTYAMGFACKAKDLLRNAEVLQCEFEEQNNQLAILFNRFDVVVGTSAKGISYQNVKRIPVFLSDFDLSLLHTNSKVAIVFGRESTGLSNEQILLTDFLIKIPAAPSYPTLNISQAVGVILYDLYQRMHTIEREQVIPATKLQKKQLIDLITLVIEQTPLQEYRNERTIESFHNIIGRAFSSQKEVTYLFAFFKKLNLGIHKPELFHSLEYDTKIEMMERKIPKKLDKKKVIKN